MEIFTLAPSDLDTSDPVALENGYKHWSTFKCEHGIIWVRSNRTDTAGGQTWKRIAHRVKGLGWLIDTGAGHFGQGGSLLARYLISKGRKVRSRAKAFDGEVTYYKATAKVYSLPSLLNNGVAVVSRDRLADERAKARKVDIGAAMAARKAGSK